MTAQVVQMVKPQSVNALIQQAKAAWDRADEKKADADDWYIRTGKMLIALKEKVGRGNWEKTLKKLGRSSQRASELMRLATGDLNIDKLREDKRKSVKKASRKKRKSPLASGDLPEADEDEEEWETGPEGDQSKEERWQNSVANACGDMLAREAYWDKEFGKGWRKFELPSHIKKLVKEAATVFAAFAATVTAKR